MPTPRRLLTSAAVIVIVSVSAGLVWLWPALPWNAERGAEFIGFHAPPQVVDGAEARWARSYSKITIALPLHRPLRLRAAFRAPPNAPRDGVRAVVTIDDVPLAEVRVGPRWERHQVALPDPAAGTRVLTIQIYSDTTGSEGLGIGVGAVSIVPSLTLQRVLESAAVAVVVGVLVWTPLQPWRLATIPYLVGFVPAFWFPNGAVLAWLWVAFVALMAAGRLVCVATESYIGPSAVRLYRNAVFHFFVGISCGALSLFLYSFFVKRLVGRVDPLPGWWFALVFGVALAVAGTTATRKGATRHLRPSSADVLTLATFFSVVVLLAGRHATALYGYTVDPRHHIAWVNQIGLHGFVPDYYAATNLLVDYPLAFHTYAWMLGAVTPLPAAVVVNVMPGLTSALFVYVVLLGTWNMVADFAPQPADASGITSWVAFHVLFVGLAIALNSSQFAIWDHLEGTARLTAGLVHIVPVLTIVHAARALAGASGGGTKLQLGLPVAHPETKLKLGPTGSAGGAGRLPWAPRPAAGFALRLVVLMVGAAISFVLNPAHLPLQILLSLVAIALESAFLLRTILRPPKGGHYDVSRSGFRRALGACAIGLALSGGVLAADPFGWMLVNRYAHLGRVDDVVVVRRQAAFTQELKGQSCFSAECLGRAYAENGVAAAMFWPWRTLALGPVDFVARQMSVDGLTLEPATRFPDLTGWTVDPPIHRPAAYALAIVPALFVLARPLMPGGLVLVVVALMIACGVDLWVRNMLVMLIHPFDPELRLIPPYMTRASLVFFNQVVWCVFVGAVGAAFGKGLGARLKAGTTREARLKAGTTPERFVLALGWIAIAAISVTLLAAWPEVQRRVAMVQKDQKDRTGPTLADLNNLKALERRVMPADESYLVTSRERTLNLERWIVPEDNSVDLYLHSSRPTLFLYFHSRGAAHTASDLGMACAALRSGTPSPGGFGGASTPSPGFGGASLRRPAALEAAKARWVAIKAGEGETAQQHLQAKMFCGAPLVSLFPQYAAAGSEGAITLYRLW